MGSIGTLSHHTDVHDGYNTEVLPYISRSKKYDLLHMIIDALCIGENTDELDGNKQSLRVLAREW